MPQQPRYPTKLILKLVRVVVLQPSPETYDSKTQPVCISCSRFGVSYASSERGGEGGETFLPSNSGANDGDRGYAQIFGV